MTASEAIEICRLKAERLNYPWSSEAAIATRRRVWPFPPFWRVRAYIHKDNLTIKMMVREQTREARLVRATWAVSSPPPIQARVFLSSCIKLIVSGCLFWLFARYLQGWPIWASILFAIPCSYFGLIFYTGIVDRMRSKRYKNDKTDAA